jgi:hypothetical protein
MRYWWVYKLCPAATGLSLVTLFSLSVSIKDRPLLWMVVRSQTYYPEHILTFRSGNDHCFLVVGSDSFRTDWLKAGKGGGLSTALRPGLKCEGLESKFRRGPGPLCRSGMSWSCLYLGYKRGVCFGVPSWDTLVHESPFLWDGTIWLWSSTVVRTGIWKMVKWFWFLNPSLKIDKCLPRMVS